MNEFERRVTEALGKIDAGIEAIKENLARGEYRLNDHGKRIRALERKIFGLWIVGPILLGLAAFAGQLKGLFIK
ncbi:hypothetical protein LCGC14_2173510 [marine sediment metagenome]|uniref:Uncharacterized protein n=1 Tax=marine sediment metagenome TaxID=412755 RepID=A0A0F9DPE7_9ZZZZ